MPNTNEIVVIPNLEDAIRIMQRYITRIGLYIPLFKLDLAFDKNGFLGKRTVKLDYSAGECRDLVISQEGRLDHERTTFRDMAKMDVHERARKGIVHIHFSDFLDKRIQRIEGENHFPEVNPYGLNGIYKFYSDDWLYIVKFYPTKWYLIYNIYPRGGKDPICDRGGAINCHPKYEKREQIEEDVFSAFIKNLFRKFQANTTEIQFLHKGDWMGIPYQGAIDASEFALYLLVTKDLRLRSLSTALDLLSAHTETEYNNFIVLVYEGDNATLKQPPLLINGKINLNSPDYRLLTSEDSQRAYSVLQEFMKQAKAKYEPLLKAIEEAKKAELPVQSR